jgi:hypothetical protein
MTATVEETAVDALWQGPGLYPDLPIDAYHADIVPGGSLSSSGARKLMDPSCPAIYRYEQDNPQPAKKIFDIGHAAHRLVLDDGPELVVVDRPRWDTNEVKAEIRAIRAAGNIPLKPAELAQVKAMADVIRRHPKAGPLLEPGSGEAEQSLFWTDLGSGINRRSRLDWFRYDGRIVDYKTCTKTDFFSLSKHVHEYGYHQQDDWYTDSVEALGMGPKDTEFNLVFQMKTPPYVVTVVRLDLEARRIGRLLNQTALHLYATCMESGHWPGHSEEVELLSLPSYIEREYN